MNAFIRPRFNLHGFIEIVPFLAAESVFDLAKVLEICDETQITDRCSLLIESCSGVSKYVFLICSVLHLFVV